MTDMKFTPVSPAASRCAAVLEDVHLEAGVLELLADRVQVAARVDAGEVRLAGDPVQPDPRVRLAA